GTSGQSCRRSATASSGGWCRALKVQAAKGALEPIPEVEAAVAAYKCEMDHVGKFLRTFTVTAPEATVGSEALYDAYKAWCDETGREPLKLGAFRQALEEREYEAKRR